MNPSGHPKTSQNCTIPRLWGPLRITIVWFSLMCVLLHPLWAQNQQPALWLEHGWEKKVPYGLRLSLTPELRLQPANAERTGIVWMGGHYWWVERMQTDLALQKRWKGGKRLPGLSFSLLGAGRTIFRNVQQGIGPRLRWYSDARVQWETKKCGVGYRVRYQQQFDDFSSANTASAVSYVRQKISLQYSLSKRWQLGISEDLWFPVGGGGGIEAIQPDHRRSSVSVGYSRKRVSWDLAITHDRELWDADGNPRLWILQIGRSWKLGDRNKSTAQTN
ncbi:MAG: hypothetical protein FJ344_08550 [Sphingomonadales bacterium]|nr:hypothetical protein [Sphingomonadales bacterium]